MADDSTASAVAAARREPLWLRLAPVMFLLLWSGGYSAVKIGLNDIEPVFFLALRYMVVLAVLLPAYLVLRPPLPATGAEWGHLVVVGILVQGIYFGGTNIAIKLGASAVALAIVLALQPILVALLAPRLAGETVGRRVWLGLGLGLTGALVAILAKSRIGDTTLSGILTACVSLLFITAGTLYDKRLGSAQHAVVANAVQCGAALVVALPLALALEECRVNWTIEFALSLAYLALGNSIVAMTLLFAMLRRGAASRASALFFLVPPTSAVIALALIGEPMPLAVWAGMALAAAGVAIVRRA